MPIVSVIVPVYGVEKYIERCARSLFEQTLDDIEYLFIDDCTPDRSIEILKQVLEEYPQRKPQVVIHKMEKNSGQAVVRKWGIQNATGNYVIHCDSDDYLPTYAYEHMWKALQNEDVDILFFNYSKVKLDGTFICEYKRPPQKGKESLLKYMLAGQSGYNPLWAAIVRKELYNEPMCYPIYNQGEDGFIMLQLVYKSRCYSTLDESLYNYCINPDSITNKLGEKAILNRYEGKKANTDSMLDFINEMNDIDRFSQEIQAAKYRAKRTLNGLTRQKKYYKLWRNTYREIDPLVFFNKYLSFREKVGYLLTLIRMK